MRSTKRRGLKKHCSPKAKPKSEVTLAQPQWDMGPRPALRAGMEVIEEVGEVDPATGRVVNPNGTRRLRYVDNFDLYHRKGWVSDGGYKAGCALRAAWEKTGRAAAVDWSQDRVDHSPKPDAAIAIQIDRVSALVSVTRRIPPGDADLLHAVVCLGRPIAVLREYKGSGHERGKAHLRDALDRLAARLGL